MVAAVAQLTSPGETPCWDNVLDAPLLDAKGHAVASAASLFGDVRTAVAAADAGPRSAALPPADVPVVDIAPFLEGASGGDTAAREATVRTAVSACRQLGFMSVRGHGVPDDVVATLRKKCRQLFALSAGEKALLRASSVTSRGHHGLGSESNSAVSGQEKAAADLRETFDVGPPEPGFEPNAYPAEELVPGFREAVEAYYWHMERMERALLALFTAALSLDSGRALPADWAQKAIGRHRGLLRLNYYPRCRARQEELRCGAHTDWDPFTVLLVERQGLEVAQEGQWYSVPVVEGCFVVNVGDTLQRWSNGRFKSSIHRVNAEGCADADRLSFAFFSTEALDTSDGSVVEPIVADGEQRRYEPLCIRDYLARNFAALQGRRNAQAQQQ